MGEEGGGSPCAAHKDLTESLFSVQLLDLFPEEGGQKGKKHPRLIPFLPGKNYSKFLKNKDVAEKRLPELQRYSRCVCLCTCV